MDQKILEAIYDGKIYVAENIVPKNPDYNVLCDRIEEEQEHFLETLPPEESKRLCDMLDMINRCSSIFNYESFSYGFRLGVNLLVEGLTNTNDLLRND